MVSGKWIPSSRGGEGGARPLIQEPRKENWTPFKILGHSYSESNPPKKVMGQRLASALSGKR